MLSERQNRKGGLGSRDPCKLLSMHFGMRSVPSHADCRGKATEAAVEACGEVGIEGEPGTLSCRIRQRVLLSFCHMIISLFSSLQSTSTHSRKCDCVQPQRCASGFLQTRSSTGQHARLRNCEPWISSCCCVCSTEEEDLNQFLQRVQHDRFEHLIQAIANEEEIAETEFSPETAESFLSEEEKESRTLLSHHQRR